MRFFNFLTISVLISALVACSGWHLRGSNPQVNASQLENAVFLSGRRSATFDDIQSLLRSRNLLSTTKNAYQLILGEERFRTRTASRSNDGNAAETELSLSLPYKIVKSQASGEQTLIDTRTELTRSYTVDINDIGAQEKQEDSLKNDMSRAAARAILRRLILISQE